MMWLKNHSSIKHKDFFKKKRHDHEDEYEITSIPILTKYNKLIC
jgi:hypothetical protein